MPRNFNKSTYNSKIKFEIVRKIGVLSSSSGGWFKELNFVSWNGNEPKFDIRDWAPDHSKMGKGITLTYQEAAALARFFQDEFPEGD